MQRTRVKDILSSEQGGPAGSDGLAGRGGQVLLKGWVRTRRDSKDFSFLELNDGSCLANVQVLVDHTPELLPLLERLKFIDGEPGDKAAPRITFKERLAQMVAEGTTFPCFFASTEY